MSTSRRPTGMRPPSPTRLVPLLAALLAAGLAAGCSGPDAEPSVEPATSAPSATAPTPEGPGPTTAPVAPATQPDDTQATAVRVLATGQVRTGGGPGCLLLAGERGRLWLLVGATGRPWPPAPGCGWSAGPWPPRLRPAAACRASPSR
jgi:hypothetical protein